MNSKTINMRPWSKLWLVFGSLAILNIWLGFDLRFTIINVVWCIPIVCDWFKEEKKK